MSISETEIVLTPEQEAISQKIIDFVKSGRDQITVGGYAGTGKTTMVNETAKRLRELNQHVRESYVEPKWNGEYYEPVTINRRFAIGFCAYTGRAASVLEKKTDIRGNDYCGTIHGMIYQRAEQIEEKEEKVGKSGKVKVVKKKKLIFTRRKHLDMFDLIICDEASMVPQDLYDELMWFNKPVVFIGDHGQLPPVKSELNLMQNPEFRLETVMRQAQNNPIIKLSMDVRNGNGIPFDIDLPNIQKWRNLQRLDDIPFEDMEDWIILTLSNATRVKINRYMRQRFELEDEEYPDIPKVGDRLVCLANNKDANIFNGQLGVLTKIEPHSSNPEFAYWLEVNMESGQKYAGAVSKLQFNKTKTDYELRQIKDIAGKADLFDFAYCITCHKSQGSEFKNVVIVEEYHDFLPDGVWNKWLYTAVTRARENLWVIKK